MKSLKVQFKAVLRSVNRQNLAKLISEWGFLDENEIAFLENARLTKAEAVNRLATLLCDEDVDFDVESLGVLDLICLKNSPKSKLWQAHQATSTESQENQSYRTSGTFLKHFKNQLKGYICKTDVALIDNDGIYWIRVAFKELKRALPSVVFITHVQFSKYFYITKSKKSHQDAIKKALASVLHCEAVDAIPLAGKCLKSLIDLTVNQHSQGSFKKFRKEHQDESGNAKAPAKRKASEAFDDDFGVIDLESPRKKLVQKYVDGVFGTEEQPALEHVDYTINTRFRGTSYAVGMKRNTDIFHCRVRFEGTNVLEGFKNLTKLGYADCPLKNHLANVQHSGRNVFVMQQMSAEQTMLSQASQSKQN